MELPMSSVSNILLENEILLESGTNELEILVFKLGDYTFGINVAKVREVLPRGAITSLAKAHPSILGVFRLRETVIPVVSLRRHLQVAEGDAHSDQRLILADFNCQQTAFVVDSVERIHRLSWEQILAVPAISSLSHSPVTAVARIDERLVIMLDFEMITDQVTDQLFHTAAVANPLALQRSELKLLIADDSPTVRKAIIRTLESSGYTQLKVFINGHEAWQWLDAQVAAKKDLSQIADLLISDVEMPQVDGLHLTKKIKEHPVLKALPVLLYSSIVTPDNQKKGAAVGADAQIAKPDLAKVVGIADNLIAQAIARRGEHRPAATFQGKKSESSPQLSKPNAATVAEQAPTWEVDGDECPSETNPRVWQTFRAELGDRSRQLSKLLEKARQSPEDAALCQEVFRTLHTIKSASMVVPVNEVTRLTHLLEGQLELTRDEHLGQWPLEGLDLYADWLQELSAPGANVRQVLAHGRELLERMQAVS
jgi:two-component system chemotaxis response regulator CheV